VASAGFPPITVTSVLFDIIGFCDTGSMVEARWFNTATLMPRGEVLVAGGQGVSGGYLRNSELYDPDVQTWSSTVGSMTTARADHTATLLPGLKVLVAGGENNGGYLSNAEIYDPTPGTWSDTGSMNVPRSGHTATLLPNGKVLVAGGFSNGGSDFASAELYDPATGTWSNTGSLATARHAHTATLLPDGKVLVAGGYYGSSYLASAELYDPAMGTWSNTGPLATTRVYHAAALLPNGKVLVAGGSNDSALWPVSAELYYPACARYPSGYVPFTSVYYGSGPNSDGDRLLVGKMTMETFAGISALIPLPNSPNQCFCGTVELAPGYFAVAYVPTARERMGDFSSFGALLIDPKTGLPFPMPGVIPFSRIPDPFPWRVRIIVP
jgi:hypothetical protein